jgi:Lhr-like helicase
VLPPSPLAAVMSNEVWGEVYDRLADLIGRHRTTIVFVNTRRVAERVARHLSERLDTSGEAPCIAAGRATCCRGCPKTCGRTSFTASANAQSAQP